MSDNNVMAIVCNCGDTPVERVSNTDKNPGRVFFACANPQEQACGFFKWRDSVNTQNKKEKVETFNVKEEIRCIRETLDILVEKQEHVFNMLVKLENKCHASLRGKKVPQTPTDEEFSRIRSKSNVWNKRTRKEAFPSEYQYVNSEGGSEDD